MPLGPALLCNNTAGYPVLFSCVRFSRRTTIQTRGRLLVNFPQTGWISRGWWGTGWVSASQTLAAGMCTALCQDAPAGMLRGWYDYEKWLATKEAALAAKKCTCFETVCADSTEAQGQSEIRNARRCFQPLALFVTDRRLNTLFFRPLHEQSSLE